MILGFNFILFTVVLGKYYLSFIFETLKEEKEGTGEVVAMPPGMPCSRDAAKRCEDLRSVYICLQEGEKKKRKSIAVIFKLNQLSKTSQW